MTRETCGYQGHVCAYNDGRVQFISRYRGTEDYCVGGHRVSVNDDGTIRDATPEQKKAVELYLLDEYARYLEWNRQQRQHYENWSQVIRPIGHILPLTAVQP